MNFEILKANTLNVISVNINEYKDMIVSESLKGVCDFVTSFIYIFYKLYMFKLV